MFPNRSPWIEQLNRTRPVLPLTKDASADVAIVGGGIAGAVTAFFTLRDTQKSVVLLEADKIAHGATGHNAGQLTSYFERPLAELAAEFGLPLTIDGQRSIESAWTLLDQIVAEANLQTPLYRFTGYAGLATLPHVLRFLKDNACRRAGGLPTEDMLIAAEWPLRTEIPEEYAELYTLVPQKDILALLETEDASYIASLSHQKGCMNSALFVEELIGYLATTYPDRFSFFEGSPVDTITLGAHAATLAVSAHAVKAYRVVLCTNGFEHFAIKNTAGRDIDTAFHHTIAGRIGFMSAHVEALSRPPTAISYFQKENPHPNDPTGESYFYVTRRPAPHEGDLSYNLICVGGPEKVLPNGADYAREESCPEEVQLVIDDFLKNTYGPYPKDEQERVFCWHGLMGYTPTGIRRIGPEPINPVLLYNLGCNGVGILPSIFGGKRIAEEISGITHGPSLFDPHDARWESDVNPFQTI